jgi:methionyl-tRNA synthetase
MVSIQDFQNVQLKVGTVLSVEDHPNADKLMVIRVDLGEETPRTLVAGLKQYYAYDELKGKQIVVVANLEPAVLRGVKSEGMLLAAQEGDKVVVLTPDKPIAPGSGVR